MQPFLWAAFASRNAQRKFHSGCTICNRAGIAYCTKRVAPSSFSTLVYGHLFDRYQNRAREEERMFAVSALEPRPRRGAATPTRHKPPNGVEAKRDSRRTRGGGDKLRLNSEAGWSKEKRATTINHIWKVCEDSWRDRVLQFPFFLLSPHSFPIALSHSPSLNHWPPLK